jgi:hypothetical protein
VEEALRAGHHVEVTVDTVDAPHAREGNDPDMPRDGRTGVVVD